MNLLKLKPQKRCIHSLDNHDENSHLQFNLSSNFTNYEMNILVVYKEGSESYKEVIQDYAQSLYVNTHVKAVPHTKFALEKLEKYDLIYPDVSLVDMVNREEIVNNLTNYVRNGGNLFLEEDLYKILSKEVLGMSEIVEVDFTNQTFDFPFVPKKDENLQKLWKTYSIKKKRNTFYNIIRSIYRKLKGDYDIWAKSSDIYAIDLTKIDVKVHATPSTAVSMVNSNRFSLLSVNKYGKGNVLWTVNHIPKRGTYFGKPFITRLDLGYPDPNAKNFHFGYATINYLMRNAYLDYLAKEKYGFSIQKVFGAYGRPSCSWQNHFERIDAWEDNKMIQWIDILRKYNQIPTFSVIRGSYMWNTYHGIVILNLNVGNNSEPMFIENCSTPYLLSGIRVQKADSSYIKVEKVASPFVVDWNENGKKDLIVGAGDGKVYYYENVGANDKPVFWGKRVIKEGEKDLNVGSKASPFVVDWDEDGKKDLIVGAGDGKVYYFENVGTNDNPVFLNKGAIKEGEKDLNVGSNAAPFVVDWDGDGKIELVVGAGDGKIYYYENVGTNDNPVFINKGAIKGGERDLNVGSNASPFVVDWDEDGKKDLIVGNGDGNIFYYENVGTNEKPAFIDKRIIREAETDIRDASPFVVDWNGDGKKDFIIGVSEYGAPYPINSSYLKNKVQRNINYALSHSICIIPHYCVYYNYTPEQELCELEMHKKTFNDLGIPWKKVMGTNHHGWNAHPVPVWQTIYTEKDFGLVYDFGWHSMAADFEKLHPTTYPYTPYSLPFLLMKNDTEPYPFIMWTPNTSSESLRGEYMIFDGKSGLFVFPSFFDLPITYYYHPEASVGGTKLSNLISYFLFSFKYNVILNRLDLRCHASAYILIRFFNELIKKYEYNMMSEEQAAKAMLNMYYTKVDVKITGSKLTLIPNTDEVPETAEEYIKTLGIKIELHPDFKSKGIKIDSYIYYKPTSRQIYFGLYKETYVNLNERAEEGFHLVRCNVPFELNDSSDNYEITVKSAGMGQFKIFSPHPLLVKDKDVVFEREGNYYMITDYGNLNKTISINKKRSILHLVKALYQK